MDQELVVPRGLMIGVLVAVAVILLGTATLSYAQRQRELGLELSMRSLLRGLAWGAAGRRRPGDHVRVDPLKDIAADLPFVAEARKLCASSTEGFVDSGRAYVARAAGSDDCLVAWRGD